MSDKKSNDDKDFKLPNPFDGEDGLKLPDFLGGDGDDGDGGKRKPPSNRTAIVWTLLLVAIFFVVGAQFAGMSRQAIEDLPTDELITSDFIAAVEDGRVTSVEYAAGENSVSGTYYPAATAGAGLLEAFNTGFDAISAALEAQGLAAPAAGNKEDADASSAAAGVQLEAEAEGEGAEAESDAETSSDAVSRDEAGAAGIIIPLPEDAEEAPIELLDAADRAASGAAIQTQALTAENLGKERKFHATWVGSDQLTQLMAAHPNIPYKVTLPNNFLSGILAYLPMILLAVFFIWMFYQMNKANNSQMSFGRTKGKIANEERPDVKFSDVAGVDEAVEEMQEIRDFLANPKKYQDLGAKIPRGCLLVGPPGTGKTLLARAVAGEAGVPFFSISGSDFVEMFVGVGASRVRDLFKQAKDAAPAIVFIDEIDAVGRQRGTGLGGGHDEREQTLNQLLVEMDGFDASESVVLIAATNRADVLDPALLRPGRFDRQIVVDTPDVKGRLKILQVHAKGKPLAQDVDLDKIAKLTPGFTGADLSNLLNESALLTARRGKTVISMEEVQDSMERVIAGPERKGRVMDDATKRTIAYHESGHALVGHVLPQADPVHKISIVSRGRALGYTLSIPAEDKVLNSRNEMMQELAVFLGGRVAEEIFCDDITTGASNDLERATKMARQMVTQYGMSDELGHQIFGQPNHEVFLGRDYGNTQDYSDETARRIDDEVQRIMKWAHDKAYEILSARKDQMDQMAAVLLERETIDGEACQALLDNRWEEYAAHEASEEGRAAKEAAATTVAPQVEEGVDPSEASASESPVGALYRAPEASAPDADDGAALAAETPAAEAVVETPASEAAPEPARPALPPEVQAAIEAKRRSQGK